MKINHAHEERESSDTVHRQHHRFVMTMRVELRVDDVALSIERQRFIDSKTFSQNSEFENENRMKLSSCVLSIDA